MQNQTDCRGRVQFVNNDGGGFADLVPFAHGTTVKEFFEEQMGDVSPNDYLITVNGAPVQSNKELMDGDKVAVTPKKVQGAN